MKEEFVRTAMLYSPKAMERIQNARIAVFGLGGVGGYAVEALARSGIGALDLVDNDTVSISNRNRQILATTETVGHKKTEVAAERVLQINPACHVKTYPLFYLHSTPELPDFQVFDYVIDAIDTVTGKLALIETCKDRGVPIISVMGTGNKTDLQALTVADIYETSVCPLARVMRKELKDRGIDALKVIYSPEKPLVTEETDETPPPGRRSIPGSNAFVPAAAGLLAAQTVINDLIKSI